MRKDAWRLGMDDYLSKPVKRQALGAAILRRINARIALQKTEKEKKGKGGDVYKKTHKTLVGVTRLERATSRPPAVNSTN